MKTQSGTSRFVTIALVGAVVSLALTLFAQGKKGGDPKTHGIRLIMGHKNREPLHCSEKSLNDALSKCDAKAYKIKYKDADNRKEWEKGELDDLTMSELAPIKKETGGAVSPPPATGMAASGVHSTQQVAFGSVDELKSFVGALEPN